MYITHDKNKPQNAFWKSLRVYFGSHWSQLSGKVWNGKLAMWMQLYRMSSLRHEHQLVTITSTNDIRPEVNTLSSSLNKLCTSWLHICKQLYAFSAVEYTVKSDWMIIQTQIRPGVFVNILRRNSTIHRHWLNSNFRFLSLCMHVYMAAIWRKVSGQVSDFDFD